MKEYYVCNYIKFLYKSSSVFINGGGDSHRFVSAGNIRSHE